MTKQGSGVTIIPRPTVGLGEISRTIKEPLVRKNEILDAAEKLFYTRGYGKTTVNDI